MFILSVTLNNRHIASIPFTSRSNLFNLLAVYDHTRIRSACQGRGTCGQCLVRIDQGGASELTHYEYERLNASQIARDIRLACQVTLFDHASVTLINPLAIEALDTISIHPFMPSANARYAVAVDLGSTQLRMSLWDYVNQHRVAGYCGFNPQAYYGTDILNRLTAATTDKTKGSVMSELIQDTIERVVTEWINAKNVHITEILIVGNTAMLALLANKHTEQLLQPAYWTHSIDCSLNFSTLRQTQIPVAAVQPVAGFVGSDLLVGLLAARLTQSPGSALFIDFGTNTEIALWHQDKLWLTSVPGGPAFEGCGISYGIAAEQGAISHVNYDAGTGEFHGALIGTLIDTSEIKGLCGSGLCDVMACLLASGQLKKNGRFAKADSELEIELVNLHYRVTVKKQDIDIFQRAKAATGAGIAKLLALAEVSSADLTRLCIAGSFGQFLNIQHAQAIGLLPDCAHERVELCGNAALMGCEQLLSSHNRDEQLNELKRKVEVVNLSQVIDYEEAFVDNLYLQPILLN
ncbi:ASKHA domain-containing protein [Methylobacter sp.]|uniref:ASKHA domain-containing protein n=1 Tax=Methylobacter sp. TaxID=2051955 RepID=UPI001213F53A|nr:ASKHA domain-containing protein [Methylobacter sp.]TAK61655.1 MAG: DUF4445 domain-containing protein [Methylobacter sp.]